MLKMKKSFILIILLLVFILGIVAIDSYVQASGSDIDINEILNNSSYQNVNSNTNYVNIAENTNTNTDTNVNTNTNTLTNANNTVNTNTNTNTTPVANTNTTNDIPSAGIVEDTAFFIAIIAFVLVAIYAYKKVRDYRS